MTSRPPLSVILAGPPAVAAWFAERATKDEASANALVTHLRAMMQATHMDGSKKLTLREIAEIQTAIVQFAAIVAYGAAGGMRGPARDGLSECLDGAFDLIDASEARVPEFAALIEQIRSARK